MGQAIAIVIVTLVGVLGSVAAAFAGYHILLRWHAVQNGDSV